MKKKGIIGFNKITVILIFIYFIFGIGLSYAYFAFSYENTSTIVGNVVNVDATLTVELVVGTDTKLVPMMDDALGNALLGTGSDNGACIDSLGNLSCQVYKITLTNNATRLQHLVGTIELYAKDGSGNAYSNLKWQELSSTTQVKEGSIVNGMEESLLVKGLTLESKETREWYVAVWLSETENDQKEIDKGEFQGTVTFEVDETLTESLEKSNPFARDYMIPYARSDADIDFGVAPSESGTNGIYVRNDTINDIYPIYYYRGNVNNNNMVFADTCWKVVRTTETGGLKLLYNGESTYVDGYEILYSLEESDYNINSNTNFSYNSNYWDSYSYGDTEILEFSVLESGDYVLFYKAVWPEPLGGWTSGYANIYINNNLETSIYFSDDVRHYMSKGSIKLDNLNVDDVIKVEHISSLVGSSVKFKLLKGDGEEKQIPFCKGYEYEEQINTKKFNESEDSLVYVGYMYGDDYNRDTKDLSNNTTEYIYSNDVSYSNGTYTLTGETISGSWSSVYNGSLNNYHYTCFSDRNSCTSVNYIFSTNSSQANYIVLNGENNIEEVMSNALDKNNTSSTIKGNNQTEGTLDYWYYNTITSTSYEDYVEDTVWCNDRSIYDLGSWNPDGGSMSSNLYFSAYNRVENKTPSLICSRDVDKFTVSNKNGNGDLDYPVGLLTVDEMMLAGSGYSYMNDDWGYVFVSSSPSEFTSNIVKLYNYVLWPDDCSDEYSVVRPSISLKPGFAVIEGGDGTGENPYVVE